MGFLFQKVKQKPSKSEQNEPYPETPSITATTAEAAKEDLRILKIEKEIVGFALSRFDAAETEGKITKDDRIYLFEKYGEEMKKLEKQIKRKELVIRLHELEKTQVNLIQMFQDKLDELNSGIKQIQLSLTTAS